MHRKSDAGEIYFLANTENIPQKVNADFRVQDLQAERWDPLTGRVQPAEIVKSGNGVTSLDLDLQPYSSEIIVFTRRTLPAQIAASPATSQPQVIDISHGWEVAFGKNAKPVMMENLSSWTDNPATRYFSGVAVYEKKVSLPADMLKKGLSVRMIFGAPPKSKTDADDDDSKLPADIEEEPKPESGTVKAMMGPTKPGPKMQAVLDAPVREAAVVYINGKRAGSVWCPPYSIDVTGLLETGENQIRIEVANLAVNYMADFKNHPLPDYKALNARFGERFQPQNMDKIRPIPSGLLGPITIAAEKAN